MKARIIHTKIYDDSWFRELSRASKLLFLYLISNESVGLIDTYELPDGKICYQTGLTQSELNTCKEELKSKAFFYKDWVRIPNLEKYQMFLGTKNEIAKEKERNLIPPDVADRVSIGYQYPSDTTSNHNQYSVISNKGGVGENKYSKIDSLTDDVCEQIGKHYGVSTIKVINIRESMKLYCKANGKKYSDYHAALQNWVRREIK